MNPTADLTLVPELSTDNITIGDPITYTLRVPLDQGPVSLDLRLQDFVMPKERVLTSITHNIRIENGQWIYADTFTTFETGGFKIGGFNVYRYHVQDAGIYVRSVLADSPSLDLRDLKGPYHTFSWLWFPLFLGLFAGGFLGWWLWKKYKNRPLIVEAPPLPTVSAHDIWQRYEEYFSGLDLNQVQDWPRFYFETSQKLKEAFFEIHHIDIRDLTTYEIEQQDLDPFTDMKVKLLELLYEADQVKFAKHLATAAEVQAYLLALNHLVAALEPPGAPLLA